MITPHTTLGIGLLLPDNHIALLQPLSNGTTHTSDEPAAWLVASAMLILVPLLFLYIQLGDRIDELKELYGIEPFDPAVSTDGPIAIHGTVRAADETLTAPLSNEECVAYRHSHQNYTYGYTYGPSKRRKLRRMDKDRYDNKSWTWSTYESESENVPFHLETEDGLVAVDPDGASVTKPDGETETPRWLTRFRYRLTKGTESIPIIGMILGPLIRVVKPVQLEREVVSHLDPGEEVLVIGDAETESGSSETVATVADSEPVEQYRITQTTLGSMRRSAVWRLIKTVVPFLLPVALGVGLLVYAYSLGVFSELLFV